MKEKGTVEARNVEDEFVLMHQNASVVRILKSSLATMQSAVNKVLCIRNAESNPADKLSSYRRTNSLFMPFVPSSPELRSSGFY